MANSPLSEVIADGSANSAVPPLTAESVLQVFREHSFPISPQGGIDMRSLACLIGTVALLWAPLPIHAQPEAPLSMWYTMLRENPSLTEDASDLEREILQLMTERQAQYYLQGTDPSEITLMNGETLEMFLMRKGVSTFVLSWHSIDGGGGTMAGGEFILTSSVGQPDAGAMSGGDFILTGGFLSIGPSQPPATLCGTPGGIFCDGFESGDLTGWFSAVGAI